MARCQMCGLDVPVGPDGKCFLGHRVHDRQLSQAPDAQAVVAYPQAIQPSARYGYEALAALADEIAPAERPVVSGADPYEELRTLPGPAGQVAPPLAQTPAPFQGLQPPLGPPSMPQVPAQPPAPQPLAAMQVAAQQVASEPVVQATVQPAPVRPVSSPPAVPQVAGQPLFAPETLPSRPANDSQSAESLLGETLFGGGEPLFDAPAGPAPAQSAFSAAMIPTPSGTQATVPPPMTTVTSGTISIPQPLDPFFAAAEPPNEMFYGTGQRRSRMGRLLAMVLVLALGAGGAGYWFMFGPAKGVAEGATYRRIFVEKESHRYSFKMTLNGNADAAGTVQPFDMGVAMTLDEQTLSVDPSGVATVRYGLEDVSMTLNDEVVPLPVTKGLGITARIAPDGKVLSTEGTEGLGFGDLGPIADLFGPESMGPLLPSGRVKPGDSWTATSSQKIPFLDKPFVVTARNKLLRLQGAGKDRIATISSHVTMPLNFKMKVADLMEAMAASGIEAPPVEIPSSATFEYSGTSSMDLIQSIVAATGRETSVSGTGVMDFTMKVNGIPGASLPSIHMHFDMTIDMAELTGKGLKA